MKCTFVGDICPTAENVALFAAGNGKELFTNTASLFEGKDFTFVNLECALTESENRIPKFGPNLKAPAATAAMLKELGVHCCGLSNNHVFDFGKEGEYEVYLTDPDHDGELIAVTDKIELDLKLHSIVFIKEK